MKTAVIGLVCTIVLGVAPFAAASTGHWCGSVWSDFPCTNSSYGYTAPAPYNSAYSYQYANSYPYNYGTSYNNYSYQQYPQYAYNTNTYYGSNNYTLTPTCSITYSTNGNYSYGYTMPITLSWSSANASSAYLSSSAGAVPLSGTMTVYPGGASVTYSLTVSGVGGTRSCSTTYYPQYYTNQNAYQQYPNAYQYGYPYTY